MPNPCVKPELGNASPLSPGKALVVVKMAFTFDIRLKFIWDLNGHSRITSVFACLPVLQLIFGKGNMETMCSCQGASGNVLTSEVCDIVTGFFYIYIIYSELGWVSGCSCTNPALSLISSSVIDPSWKALGATATPSPFTQFPLGKRIKLQQG